MGENMRVLRALGLSAVFFFLSIGAVSGSIDVYPVSGLERGAVGVGYTVVEETKIEPFIVEVLGVMERAGPAGSLILVRTSGELIDRVGGIASGMSGSPVYIDGKLLGAIGYGFQFADHRIGLVTPAADMLAVMELIEVKDEAPIGQELVGPAPTRLEPSGGERAQAPAGIVLAESAWHAEELRAALPPEVWVASPVATPLIVDGLGPRTMDRLEKIFAGYNVVPIKAGRPLGAVEGEGRLEPGAALGVQLVRGDVDVTAIGTVTAVDGDRFVAFGHPFLNRGDVDHFVTGAYIFHTVSSLSFPFKIGAPLAPVGRLLQDRGAAIAGVMGEKPKTVSMSVEVSDRDRRVNEHFEVEIARDRELTVPLIIVSALEAVDRTLDRLGAGTSRVTFSIDGEGMPRELVRENVFYSGSDIAAASVSELLVGVDLLQGNEFQDPGITEVSVSIEVEAGRQTARIERAEPQRRRVRQGETVDVVVTLRPYRAPAFDVTIPLEIPPETALGPVMVSVRGGIFGGYAPLPDASDGDLSLPVSDESDDTSESPLSFEAESLEKLIDEFEKEPRNNEVVVEFYPSSFFGGRRGFLRSDQKEGENDESSESREGSENHESREEQESSDEDGGEEPGEESHGKSEGGPVEDLEEEELEEQPEEELEELESDLSDPTEFGPVRAVYPTDYVVHGEAQFSLTIISGRESEQEDASPKAEEPPSPPSPVEPSRDQGVHPINAQ